MRIEFWAPVAGHDGLYEVSMHGEVRSVTRSVEWGRHGKTTYQGRTLKQFKSKNGYWCVKLSLCGVTKTHYVHHLVLRGFVGERPKTEARGEIRHLDGNKLNNTLLNLQYGTIHENVADRIRHQKERAVS